MKKDRFRGKIKFPERVEQDKYFDRTFHEIEEASIEVFSTFTIKHGRFIEKIVIYPNKDSSPHLFRDIFRNDVAKNIVTGHLLAVRYNPLWLKTKSKNKKKISSRKFSKIETTKTDFTADAISVLKKWGETNHLQALSQAEGVSLVTIRNRYQDYQARRRPVGVEDV